MATSSHLPTHEIAAMAKMHQRLVKNQIVRSCLNCIQFNPKTEGCDLAGGQRPPAEVIVYACNLWDQDIPF